MSTQLYSSLSTSSVKETWVDFETKKISDPVNVVQYDDSEDGSLMYIKVNLKASGEPYYAPAGVTVRIRLGLYGGYFAYYDALGFVGNRSVVAIPIRLQMTMIYGDYYPVVEVVSSDGDTLGAAPFRMQIAKSPVQYDSINTYIKSSEGFLKIHQMADEAEAQAAAAKASEVNSLTYSRTSQSYAVGDAVDDNGNSFRSGQEVDNSKYYNRRSQSYAVGNAVTDEGEGFREGQETDNSKYYNRRSQSYATGDATNDDGSTFREGQEADNSKYYNRSAQSYAIGDAVTDDGESFREGQETDNSKYYNRRAQSYAVGNAVDNEGNPFREGQETDNSEYYSQMSKSYSTGDGVDINGNSIRDGQTTDNSSYYSKIARSYSTGDAYDSDGNSLREDQETDNSKYYSDLSADSAKASAKSAAEAARIVEISIYQGATETEDGYIGLVPAAEAGKTKYVLTGDGEWTKMLADYIFADDPYTEDEEKSTLQSVIKNIFDAYSTEKDSLSDFKKDVAAKYLPLTGGTLTGALNVNNADVTVYNGSFVKRLTSMTRGKTPSANKYWAMYYIDNNSKRLGYMMTSAYTNGSVETKIAAYQNASGDSVAELGVYKGSDGTAYAYAPTPSNASDSSTKIATTAWVTNKCGNYLPLSGGTMTGTLINTASVHLRNGGVTKGSNPSSTIYWARYNVDKDGVNYSANALGLFETRLDTSGNVSTYIRAMQNTASSTSNAELGVYKGSDGTAYAYAPTPSSTSDRSTKIATTAWVGNMAAPKSHATTATTYGIGTASNYGHVKLSDTYASVNTSQKAANGVAASAWALQTAYANRPAYGKKMGHIMYNTSKTFTTPNSKGIFFGTDGVGGFVFGPYGMNGNDSASTFYNSTGATFNVSYTMSSKALTCSTGSKELDVYAL